MATFSGIPADAVRFYRDLAHHNSKQWWAANKERYAVSVREPMEDLLAGLADEFGEGAPYRPHRDVRFSADKSPYKDHQGALVHVVDGMGYYLQVSGDGLTTGAGYLPKGPDQLARLRAAIDAPATGQELGAILDRLDEVGFDLEGETLRTRPRGVAPDHPRLELMRLKNVIVTRRYGEVAWMASPEALDRVREDWRSLRPLVTWLVERVGPSTEPTGLARRR
jgi:uncharacterized protein (TIGR02453 family)